MGTFKKEANRKERQGKVKGDPKVKGENFYRDAKKVKLLGRLTKGKAQRNADGKITKAAAYQSTDIPQARIEPHRKWFTNSRVISQDALATFREAVSAQTSDPYSYLLKRNKLPMTLIKESTTENGLKRHQAKMALETMSFSDTFGPNAKRKRVTLPVGSIEDFAKRAEKLEEDYNDKIEEALALKEQAGDAAIDEEDDMIAAGREAIFNKGQSKRIWNELYKVIDSSDVIIHVLDARDPLGTRCRSVEKYIREEAAHKHLLFALNKADLIPSKVASRWVKILSREYPTLAFRSSITNPFGKGALINVLRQFSSLHPDRKQISVGFIGYPNTGKSSMINALRAKKVCTVAPIPGETKEWQYITLMKRIYLIDCPGVVPPSAATTDEDILLRGAVRVEKVENPAQYVEAALGRCRRRHVELTYEVPSFSNAAELLEMVARKRGRLLKGGDPDLDGVAKIVLSDFIRGKLPWCTLPPVEEGQATAEGAAEGEDADGDEGEDEDENEDGDDDQDGEDGEKGAEESEFEGFSGDEK